ncbi:MAG: phosphoribosylformylglycinamidine synthase [Lentisphaerae bacterium]|nr:phosphoribosylformylglycinamidine synthase [Lentisphaerota bacterium]
MNSVRRVFIEKKPGFELESRLLLAELRENLPLGNALSLRIFKRYDISGLTDSEYAAAREQLLHEPACEQLYEEELPKTLDQVLAIEYLPGQFDQQAATIAQCLRFLCRKDSPRVRAATIYAFDGLIQKADLQTIKQYMLNPIECRLAKLEKPESLKQDFDEPQEPQIMDGFRALDEEELQNWRDDLGLGMKIEDLAFCQKYFREEEARDPSYTELRVIDTYWSDHCRHSTFNTIIDQVHIEDGSLTAPIMADYQRYLGLRCSLQREKSPLCLMDLATIGARELKRQGKLDNLDQSEEINACSIVIEADIDGVKQPWLIMFKNETHNHPTEIEPFGGAATCLGGAIRDPLSGRAYVYQAMRITGAADPRIPLDDTLPGKLSQRQITQNAAAGYSSYGNQIGVPAGKVQEYYHPGFMAKRMELGAVLAAAPQSNVVRAKPEPGNLVLLIGGKTGRDGCGGAIGSSKAHTEDSMQECSAEVQKGNAPIERNIQNLFRKAEFARLVRRCNDFGAGGVCVAIGELADGLEIDLDQVPAKYEGLNATELAISESQERMAVVIDAKDLEAALLLADEENLEASVVARVSSQPRLQISWQGKKVVDLARSFLDSNGVTQHAQAHICSPDTAQNPFLNENIEDLREAWLSNLNSLNICSQKGLIERFDASAGGGTVIHTLGGKKRLTPNEAMVAKLPLQKGSSNTCTVMSHGYDPYLCAWSPYHGALYAVVEANARIAAAGGDVSQARMSFQEYFESLRGEAKRWGKPLAALLGALRAQLEFGTPAIGGKDSMSGSFHELDVPPTLVAFSVCAAQADKIVSPEFKGAGHAVGLLCVKRDANFLPDIAELKEQYAKLRHWISEGEVLAAHTVGQGGIAAALSKMCFGNWLGVAIDSDWKAEELFSPEYGAIIVESKEPLPELRPLGATSAAPYIICNDMVLDLQDALEVWQKPLEKVFPTRALSSPPVLWQPCNRPHRPHFISKSARPRVLIPVFPGCNGDLDLARAFEQENALVQRVLMRDLSLAHIEASCERLVKELEQSQILALPNSYSGLGEPDGAAKFISLAFREPLLSDSLHKLLHDRDGLLLGLGSGFQALLRLGLLPHGEIRQLPCAQSPVLAYNSLGRHVAGLVNTVVVSTISPWLNNLNVGQVHCLPISHGSGRFVASETQVKELLSKGQVAFQYADEEGRPAASMPWNPNGSVCAIEAVTSPDGRILGRMSSGERSIDDNICINVPGDKRQGIFAAGVQYFM